MKYSREGEVAHANALFERLVRAEAELSVCKRRKVGALGLGDSGSIYTKHNGSDECKDKVCLHEGKLMGLSEPCRAKHAEINVIEEAIANKDHILILFTTHFPCTICAQRLIQHGVLKIIYIEDYGKNEARDALLNAGVEIMKIF